METSMKEPNTVLMPKDYDNIDTILNFGERTMLQLAAAHNVLGARFERWRWDIPDITMSWNEKERFTPIGKNIRLLVKKLREETYSFTVDVNAWSDELYAGIVTKRMWTNDSKEFTPDERTDEDVYARRVSEMLSAQFEVVHDWTLSDLQRHHLLTEVRRW